MAKNTCHRDCSPESEFYGDEETRQRLEERVEEVDVQQQLSDYWAASATNPLAFNAAKSEAQRSKYNPYAPVPSAWQPDETIPQFLARMPPATTSGVPWIWVHNPYAHRKEEVVAPDGSSSEEVPLTKRAKVDGHSKDEAAAAGGSSSGEDPLTKRAKVDVLIEGGMERLHILSTFAEGGKKVGMTKAAFSSELAQETRDAVRQILELAIALKVTCGKWMLFIRPQNVNEVWAKVALATSKGELGIGAKVEPKGGDDLHTAAVDPTRPRLICIYTADFSKLDDVGRVARKLRDLGLFGPNVKQIYYKPDAFTYLGLDGSNKWKIRASIYGSKNLLEYMDARDKGMNSADGKEDGWVRYVERKR